MSRKARQPAFNALNLLRLRLIGNDPLGADDRTVIQELIDAVINDRDPRENYWETVRGISTEPMRKANMALRVAAKKQASPHKTMEEIWGEVAAECDSTYDVVMKAWGAYQKI